MVPRINDLDSLASELKLSEFEFKRVLYRTRDYYRHFQIFRRNGKRKRVIAPNDSLKAIQRWIANFVLGSLFPHPSCTADADTNGSDLPPEMPHAAFTIHAEIKNFFSSITVGRVAGLFDSLGYDEDVAEALAWLVTYRGSLPSGSPSSLTVSNLICRNLDERLAKYCAKRQWTYRRNCNQIIISGIGAAPGNSAIFDIIRSEGFEVGERHFPVRTREAIARSLILARTERRRLASVFHQLKSRAVLLRENALSNFVRTAPFASSRQAEGAAPEFVSVGLRRPKLSRKLRRHVQPNNVVYVGLFP